LSPRIIFTDELSTKEDWDSVKNAINSGVKVVATCHAENLIELKNKQCFINNLFDRYVVINKKNGFGCIENIYDGGSYLIFETKGDNNNVADPLTVHESEIVSVYKFSIGG
jgi:stage III sporulation protein AA